MVKGGQRSNWQRLILLLGQVCDVLLWFSILAVGVDQLIAQPSDHQNLLRDSVWPLVVLTIWLGTLVIYAVRFSQSKPARSACLMLTISYLVTYVMMRQEITPLTIIAMASLAFNSLFHASLSVLFINMFGLELMILYSHKLFQTGPIKSDFRLILVLGTVVYGVTLLVLSWYNAEKNRRFKTIATLPHTNSSSEDSMSTLVNNLSSGVLRLNSKLEVNLYNAIALSILDTNATLTGKKVVDFLQLRNLQGETVDIEKLIKQTTRVKVIDELLYQYKTGETIRLELTISPIKNVYGVIEDGDYILILRDVTLAKNLETERDEFISVASHELRTPIAVIEASLSNLELMLKRGSSPVLIRNTLKKAHDQALFLATMTNDLSSLARADRAEILRLEMVDLKRLLQNLFEKNQAQVVSRGLKFDLDIDPKLTKLKTFPLYLEEIVQNFLTNAIKYTLQGGITLAVHQKARTVEISVTDTGVGIAKPEQEKVFGKFYRIEDYRTRETSGTGLGLYVSKKLATKLNGKITLQSRIGFGSTFSLVLPITKQRVTRSKKLHN